MGLTAPVHLRPWRLGTTKIVAITALIGLWALMVPFTGPAVANHPANSCLDLSPEIDSNPTGTSHVVTATLGTITGTPGNEQCTTSATTVQPATTGPLKISFEVAGPNDPQDDADTPDTPDGSCFIAEGASSCTFTYTGTAAGVDTIRGWIDHDAQSPAGGGTTEADRLEGQDETTQRGTGCLVNPPGLPEPDCTDVVTKTWTASRLNCEPETDSNPSGTDHTVTCTATDEEGNRVSGTEVDVEESGAGNDPSTDTPNDTPDHTCTTRSDDATTSANEAGTCTFTDNSPQAGTTTYRAWIDDDGNDTNVNEGDTTEAQADTEGDDDTDTMTKTWTASNLNCEPETDTNAAGDQHTITCTATDEQGNRVPGTRVDAEETGAGDTDGGSTAPPDHTCTTRSDDPATTENEAGTCTFNDTSQTSGTTTYRAWIDDDGNDTNVNEGDTAETQTGDEAAGSEDDTDTVTKTWSSATATSLDCDDESGDDHETNPGGGGTESEETYTCTVRDRFGNPVGNAGVNGENESTVNDPEPEGSEGPSYEQPDYSCTTAASGSGAGRCTITVTQADAELGTAPICFWVGSSTDGSTLCPSEGIDDPEGDDVADKVEKTWSAATPAGATRLDCEPETDTNPAESAHTVTCTARNGSNVPVANAEIDVEAEGENDPDSSDSKTTPDFSCVTNANGQCTFTHGPGGNARTGTPGSNSPTSTNVQGTTTYTAWIDADNNNGRSEADPAEEQDESTMPGIGCLAPLPGPEPDCTDVVEKTWGASRLNCTPETDTNQSGDQHTVTCTATDAEGNPVSGTEVDAEYSGAGDPDNNREASESNTPDDGCTTREDDPLTDEDETGTCQFSHTSNDAGRTTYRAWIDDDGDDDNGNEGDTGEGVAAPENDDDTDVVEKEWTASRLDCFDSSGDEVETNPTGSSHTVTCKATDESGNPVQGTQVDTEASGANDPDDDAGAGGSPSSPDFSCTTGADGTCSFTHGPGGNARTGGDRANGSNSTRERGTTTYRSWIDHDRNDSTQTQDTTEARDENATPGGSAEPDDTDVTAKTWVGPGLDCSPETDTNPSGSQHTITCSARDADNQPVRNQTIDVEATGANDPDQPDSDSPEDPDFTCTTNNDGVCSFTHGDDEPTDDTGRTEYRAWVDEDGNDSTFDGDATEERCASGTGDESNTGCTSGTTDDGATPEPDNTDVVEKFWGASNLDCTPERDTNPSGSSHTVTCTATDSNGDPVEGQQVDAEATGDNDPDGNADRTNPDFTCETDEEGRCSFTHGPGGEGTTNRSGTTVYRAWVDSDRNDATDDSDPSEGQCASGTGDEQGCTPTQSGEPDTTDVVEKEWTATRLDCEPETDSNPTGSSHTVTCTARDNANQPASGQQIDAEATGANDPDGNTDRKSPDFTCTTNAEGRCSFTHGPAGTGTTNDPGTTTYRAWIDADRNNQTDESEANEPRAEGSSGEPDNTDVVEKTWTEPPLDCSPEVASNPQGTSHTVTCTASPRQAGTEIDVEATGANDPDNNADRTNPDFTCQTDASGRCTFTHGGTSQPTSQRGTTTYRAWVDDDKNNSTSEADATEGRDETATPGATPEPDKTDVVEKNWTPEPRTLTITPEADTASVGTCNPFVITVNDQAGQPIQGVFVDVEQTMATTPGRPAEVSRVEFCTPIASDGPNPSAVDTSRGDRVENPDDPATAGGETTNATNAAGQVTIGITVRATDASSGEGTVQVVAFVESTDNDDPDTTEPSDTATKTWVTGQARTIDCEPESVEADLGTTRVVTCTVRDRFGRPLAGKGVTFSEDGVGDFVSSTQQTTDADGQARATVTSTVEGTQSVVGTITDDLTGTEPAEVDECDRPGGDPAGGPAGECADEVTVVWTQQKVLASGPCRRSSENSSVVRAGGGRIIVGTSGDDVLIGTDEDDIICGLGGRDTITGNGGNDVLDGGGGGDSIEGDEGNDRLSGGGGRDVLQGGAGRDRIGGGRGIDRVLGQGGNDIGNGGGDNDRLAGGGGRDTLRGAAANDNLLGGAGNDRLIGGVGNDRLDGSGGTDSCSGGPGRDGLRRCE